MQLSNDDLTNLDDDDLLDLPEEALRHLSIKLLNDLKEAREYMGQNSHNSSRPPSSEDPWNKASDKEDITEAEVPEEPIEADNSEKSLPLKKENEDNNESNSDKKVTSKRKPGKQAGAQGYGRTQKIDVTHYEHHYPDKQCPECKQTLDIETSVAYTGYNTIDIQWADSQNPGIHLTNTKHTLYKITCACSVEVSATVSRHQHEELPNIKISKWRLVGPGLAALIICLAYRMRLSRVRICEFLGDWLGIEIAVGTIDNTLHESGAAVMPVEKELIQEIVNGALLHVDETSWKEHSTLLWLWVFSTDRVVAYWIATRSAELMDNLLESGLSGWLMSDGYCVYRRYSKRLRCWAHLLRKAEGLQQSMNKDAQLFGEQTLDLLTALIKAIRLARDKPPDKPLSEQFYDRLQLYQALCEQMKSCDHKKASALAKEMLNDWQAIFQILDQPDHPLTNNEAERALRHWVILRGICYGTRTEEGSRVFAMLISVIETCRKRNQSPWVYLATVIINQRSGLAVPLLPNVKGV